MNTPPRSPAASPGGAATVAHPGGSPRPPQPPAPRQWLSLLGPLVAVLVVALLLVAGAAAALRWALFSEGGTRWVLDRVPGLSVQGWSGALLGDRFQADALHYRRGALDVQVQALAAEGLRWHWRPRPGVWLWLQAGRIEAAAIVVDTGPGGEPGGAPQPPALTLPLQLDLGALRIARLQLNALAPIESLALDGLRLDSLVDHQHRFEQLALRWQGLALQAQAQIGTDGAQTLQATATLQPATDEADGQPAWTTQLRADGPLRLLDVQAELGAPGRPGRPDPSLQAQARVAPFAAWPIDTLQARTEALDLSALLAGLPQTRLSGTVLVQAAARDAPIEAQIELSNAAPGRWDQQRLPVRTLALALRGNLDAPDRVEASRIELQLADGAPAARNAGRLRAQALWEGRRATIEATLDEIQPQRLDGRAPAMTISGPLQLALQGLPSPDPAAEPPATPAPLEAELSLELAGRLAGAPTPVQLTLQARGNERRIELVEAVASAGVARAELQAVLERSAAGRRVDWLLQTRGRLSNFDPVAWWPGAAGQPWAQGPHRLSGNWVLDLRAPAAALGEPPLALAQSLVGNGTLRLQDSVLGGLPLQAELTIGHTRTATSAPGSVHAEIAVAGNTLLLDGVGDPGGSGAADRWLLQLDAPALAALAPLLERVPALATWAPRAGRAQASLSATGRWPQLRTEGSAYLQGLMANELGLEEARLNWRLAGGDDQPLALQVQADELRWGDQTLARLSGTLDGTAAQHRITLDAFLPQVPPPLAVQMLAVPAERGTRALLRADGGWRADAATGGGHWQARIERIALQPWRQRDREAARAARLERAAADATTDAATDPAVDDPDFDDADATAPAAPGAAPGRPDAAEGTPAATPPARTRTTPRERRPRWAEATDLQVVVQLGEDFAVQRVQAAAGALQLAQTARLRWEDIDIDLRTEPARLRLNAEIEPFALAPLLARAQPGMGWTGDLQLTARLQIDAAERFAAEVSFERHDGDLHIDGAAGLQLMGLEEFRLALSARDGLWEFVPTLRGRTLGDIRGRMRVRTAPERRWPDSAAPLQGGIEARVADLGIWSNWVPPGWRLAGELVTRARLGGTFGEPRYTGRIGGSDIAVRNLLKGVNISDGVLDIELAGDRARIETFELRGGDGTLAVSGSAGLGRRPEVDLRFVAERFRVLGRVDRQVITSGEARLRMSEQQLRLDGQLGIDEGLFDIGSADAPSLDSDVTVRRPGDPPVVPRAREAEAEPARPIVVNVALDLGQQLRLRGRGLNTGLGGQLRITTPGGRPALAGAINTQGGTYFAYGQELEIRRGLITFIGPIDNPRLDVLALRDDLDIIVGVAITGTAQAPRVRLYSEPALSENEKLSWLVLGRAPDGLGRTDTALLQRAAVALLAGEGESPTDGFLSNFGIDEFSVRQDDGDSRDTVITVGRQLSRRWYLGYERGVNAAAGTWQLIYRVAQRLTIRAQSGLENSLDIIWTLRLGEQPEPVPPPSDTPGLRPGDVPPADVAPGAAKGLTPPESDGPAAPGAAPAPSPAPSAPPAQN
jgi:translocation and assembly module TamB